MTVQFELFEPTDLRTLRVQDAHAFTHLKLLMYRDDELRRILVGPYAWTAWSATGRPVASCGILATGYAWALLAADLRRDMVPITRKVRSILDQHLAETGPTYADIDEGNPEAVRWAGVLGFRREENGERWVYDTFTTRLRSS